jgi:hypothetical protein
MFVDVERRRNQGGAERYGPFSDQPAGEPADALQSKVLLGEIDSQITVYLQIDESFFEYHGSTHAL